MFSLDFSTINILLVTAVVALFTIFIIILMKLNPSTETKEKLETEIKVERQKPLQASPVAPRNPPAAKIDVPRVTEKPPTTVSSTVGGPSVLMKQETQAPTRSESREIHRPESAVAPDRTESASSKKDCLHQFGYLRTLPKNAPIPDECFGCPKIVECLVKGRNANRG